MRTAPMENLAQGVNAVAEHELVCDRVKSPRSMEGASDIAPVHWYEL